MTRPIFLLTDYGTSDTYAGQLRAVIAGIAPGVPIFDLTHWVEPWAVEEGAWLLETALPALPPGAIVVAVVDPGVGTARREIAVETEGRLFIGPDNGLLSAAFPREVRERVEGPVAPAATAGVSEVRELCNPRVRRQPVAPTFHGRDVFAPAAAHVAAGLDWEELGPPRGEAVLFPPFEGRPGQLGELHGRVVHVDRFGNLVTTIRCTQLFPTFVVEAGGLTIDRHVHTFGSAPRGVPFCHADSSGYLAIALNQGNAARELNLGRGAAVTVRAQ